MRAEVLAPNRLNALVFGGFAGVALTIAVVGVAGVLAFSVSARTREFGVRLAIGSAPRDLLTRVLGEGAVIAGAGILAGVVVGIALARIVGSFITDVHLPDVLPTIGAATILVTAAILASLMPAARAARVNVVEALDQSRNAITQARHSRGVREAALHETDRHRENLPDARRGERRVSRSQPCHVRM